MDTILKRTTAEKSIRKGYILAFLLLLISYLITLYTNQQLQKQMNRLEHTNQVISNLEKILSGVKDAETGVRGYIITKNLAFLTPFFKSYELADSVYEATQQLTMDNSTQQERLNRLKKYIDKRFEIFRNNLGSFNNNHQEMTDSMRTIYFPEARKIMDQIRMTVAMMEREESLSLAQRNNRTKQTFKTLDIITIVSLALAFALVAFGFVTYFQENRERKKAMQKIKDYQARLSNQIDKLNRANEQLIQMKSQEKFAVTGRIARTIAHEVRNPLTNINLAAEQLKDEVLPHNENTQFLFDMISRNSTRINHLISDLLNSTKFSELNYEKVSINTLLDETVKEAGDRIQLYNIRVEKKYSDDVCDVAVDVTKLRIAFLNIIINAIEAMENKTDGVLTLETKSEHDKCKIIISDNGTGMDDESVTRIFEPYFTNKQKGNGLGLTNTQNIILNHKGDISVKSKTGEGSTFSIELDFVK